MRQGKGRILGNGGWSMVELMIALAIIAVALCGFMATITATVKLTAVSRENSIAMALAQYAIELLSDPGDFSDVFYLYNDDPADDPDGPGTAPGPGFEGPELAVQDSDPDGMVGQILFPMDAMVPPGELRENIVDDDLGMPRDLNGNPVDDDNGANVAGGYIILPVKVRIEWKGITGDRRLEMTTLLTER